MKKLIPYILLIFLASCSNYKTLSVKKTTSLSPDIVRLDVSLDDLEYLGKTEISIASRRYLGIFAKLDSINSESYHYQNKKMVTLNGFSDIKLSGHMNKAAYKVVEEFPEATFYVPGNYTRKYHQMFLGKWIWKKMEIHAYKYKLDDK